MKPSIYVTQRIPEPALAEFRCLGDVEMNPEINTILTREELIAKVRHHDYLCSTVVNRVDADIMDANPDLKIIANIGVGYDNIDVPAATARKIPVSNTPGVLTETTADLTFALLLAVARRIVEGDRLVREGRFPRWGPMVMLGADVHGKTVGIVGFGRIGRAVAQRARGFGMTILYADEAPAPRVVESALSARRVRLAALLRQSDFVTLHTPSLPSTVHLIGPKQLAQMKSTAFLINTSRGSVIDEPALVDVLRAKRIAGAALDVFEHEPDLAPGLAGLDNVVLVPHIGSATLETRTQMALIAASNVAAVVEGRRPPTVVNIELYPSFDS